MQILATQGRDLGHSIQNAAALDGFSNYTQNDPIGLRKRIHLTTNANSPSSDGAKLKQEKRIPSWT